MYTPLSPTVRVRHSPPDARTGAAGPAGSARRGGPSEATGCREGHPLRSSSSSSTTAARGPSRGGPRSARRRRQGRGATRAGAARCSWASWSATARAAAQSHPARGCWHRQGASTPRGHRRGSRRGCGPARGWTARGQRGAAWEPPSLQPARCRVQHWIAARSSACPFLSVRRGWTVRG